MMRDLFSPRESGLGAGAGACTWIALGLANCLGCLGGATVAAGETQDERLARLGYAYDARVHAAAEAKRKGDNAGSDATPDGVVRLPKYIVSGERAPLAENGVLTPKGRLEVAKKRYLNVGYQKTLGQVAAVATFLSDLNHGWRPNGPEAMALYWDDERKRRNGELQDLSELLTLSESLKKAQTVPARTKKSGKP